MRRNFNLERLVRPNVLKMKPYSSARDESKSAGEEMIFLDANENPFPSDVNRYPDPQQRNLKEELAKIKEIEATKILLGNGSDEVLDLLFRAFCNPGKDNVITLPPTYGMYSVLANLNDIENREVLLDSEFEPVVSQILVAADENTKMVFLCSPNNPTGNSISEEKVKSIVENFEGVVVIDEAYIDFSERESWLKRIKEFPNLVVTQTLSKAYGMAGIRLGICYASEEIISLLNKIKPPYNVNILTQKRAIERLVEKDNFDQEVAEILYQRNELSKALLEVDFVKKIYLSDANFLLIQVDDANRRYDEFIQKGVVVRKRSSLPFCENTLRITVGTREENQRLLEVIKNNKY